MKYAVIPRRRHQRSPMAASPESRGEGMITGFRVRAEEARPGMTDA
jgi:hypothetical protein